MSFSGRPAVQMRGVAWTPKAPVARPFLKKHARPKSASFKEVCSPLDFTSRRNASGATALPGFCLEMHKHLCAIRLQQDTYCSTTLQSCHGSSGGDQIVFWLYIAVNDSVVMQVSDARQHLPPGLLFNEDLATSDMLIMWPHCCMSCSHAIS